LDHLIQPVAGLNNCNYSELLLKKSWGRFKFHFFKTLRNCVNFVKNKAEAASGFWMVRLPLPPVSPEVIHIQVQRTF